MILETFIKSYSNSKEEDRKYREQEAKDEIEREKEQAIFL
jgi:hypothetical protein